MAKGKSGTPVVIGGKKRYLKITMNAIINAEETSGRNFMHPMVRRLPTTKEYLAIVHGSLNGQVTVKEDGETRTVTLEELGDMITPAEWGDVCEAIDTAWQKDMPEPSDDEDPLAKTTSTSGSDGNG